MIMLCIPARSFGIFHPARRGGCEDEKADFAGSVVDLDVCSVPSISVVYEPALPPPCYGECSTRPSVHNPMEGGSLLPLPHSLQHVIFHHDALLTPHQEFSKAGRERESMRPRRRSPH